MNRRPTLLVEFSMNSLRLLLVGGAFCLVLAGCRVAQHKTGNNDNVEIGTPFGSMHVKTNESANLAGLGITVYPGAVPEKDSGDDTGSADINMNFGSFHLGVRAASYKTPDDQDRVLDFYRKDLARYGDVIECRGDNPVGEPSHTSQGLTCSDNGHNGHNVNVHPGSKLELRAGSPDHQHIVAVDPKDGGTKIGLVALDLPEHHDSSDSE
jgi:hypothetical protein